MRTNRFTPPVLLALLLCGTVSGQSASLVHEFETARYVTSGDPQATRSLVGGLPARDGFVRAGSQWYFTAFTVQDGRELWSTDGTANGTRMVADIGDRSNSGRIASICAVGNQVYFAAQGPADGFELWTSDGSGLGTVQVRDIFQGPDGSFPNWLTPFGSQFVFTASDGTLGQELWISDGTAAGTRILKDVAPGFASSHPQSLIANPVSSRVIFAATDATGTIRVWGSDGTTAGTTQLTSVIAGWPQRRGPEFANLGGHTLFTAFEATHGAELWITDGTAPGTALLKDIYPGTESADIRLESGAVFGGALYFAANDGGTGVELWRTDGTTAGTELVADLEPGLANSSPSGFFEHRGTLYFAARNAATGVELWKYDGNAASLVVDLVPGIGGSAPSQIRGVGSRIVFAAGDPNGGGNELFSSDGTAAGTTLVADLLPGMFGSGPSEFTATSASTVMFRANSGGSPGTGIELFETDGTAAGTRLLKDIEPTSIPRSGSPRGFAAIDGTALICSAQDSVFGLEPWITDAAGSRRLKDIHVGSTGSNPQGFTSFRRGGKTWTVFAADDGLHGIEPWVTDGTTANTQLLADITPGPFRSVPTSLTTVGDRLFFIASENAQTQLWTTDGTPAGTMQVAGAFFSPRDLVEFQGRLYFSADSGAYGREIWSSDGTAAGTNLAIDLRPGGASGLSHSLFSAGSHLLFVGADPSVGRELFISDGTQAGTRLLKDIYRGPSSGLLRNFVRHRGKVFFSALDSAHGEELWQTDFTTAGTKIVADLAPGVGSSYPFPLLSLGSQLLLLATDPVAGRELFATDGTASGTVLLTDLQPGFGASTRSSFVRAAGGVVFAPLSLDPSSPFNNSLYFTDGTRAGTKQILSLPPTPLRTARITDLTALNGVIYFSGDDGVHGAELMRLDGWQGVTESLPAGCVGVDVPVLDSTDWQLQSTALVEAWNPTGAPGVLAVGVATPHLTVPGLTGPGCALWLDLGALILIPQPGAQTWSASFPISNNPTLLGLQLGMQAGFGTAPIQLSNGLKVTLGQ